MNIFDFKTFINEAKKTVLSGSLVMKDRMKMRKMLRENILIFKFQKRDGTIRRAVGTLYPDLLPPVKGTGGPKPVYQMVYYDLEKMEWRSFRSFKFIKIVKSTPVTDDVIDEYKKKIEEKGRRKEEEKKRTSIHKEREERREHEEEHDKDVKKKTFKAGEKIPEDELERRSVDTRKGVRKSETTKKATDKFKKEHEEKHDKHEDHHEEHKHEERHEEKHEDHHDHHDDEKKGSKKGDKIPEKELMRRSVDLRKGSRKNKFTKKANDSFKKGELED